jgi:hypothetical protein
MWFNGEHHPRIERMVHLAAELLSLRIYEGRALVAVAVHLMR